VLVLRSRKINSMDREESIRLHMDWWGKCRTCRHWHGAAGGLLGEERWEPALCENPVSDMYGKETWTEGECRKWDSFDIDVALELLSNGGSN
jgi:hypothetical protein